MVSVESSGELQELHVSGSLFTETIRNLRPATAYFFTVIAENQVGHSQPSEVSAVEHGPTFKIKKKNIFLSESVFLYLFV